MRHIMSCVNPKLVTDDDIRHAFLADPLRDFSFELRTASFISFLLRHMTRPSALSRNFRSVHQIGPGPERNMSEYSR